MEAETHAERVARVFSSLDHLDNSGVWQPSIPCGRREQLHDPNKGRSKSRETSGNFSSERNECSPQAKRPLHWPKASAKRANQRTSFRRTPDYVKHPEKWVKYDLKEDGTEKMKGMSADQVNKAAAFEFLQMRASSGKTEVETLEDGSTEKLMFKKPKSRMQKQAESYSETDPHVSSACMPALNIPRSNVHVMEEYRVGARRERKLKKTLPALDSGDIESSHTGKQVISSVHLSHLDEDATDESM